jgi:hypothetical protein
MKKTATGKVRSGVRDGLRSEYHFDYGKAKRNRFAAKAKNGPLVVILDEDIARVFRSSETVKAVLRALISTMPARARRRTPKAPSRG